MKVLCIGDPHIKTDNLSETELMIEELERLVDENRPDLIVCMGDILDRHSTIHVQCLIMAEKLVARLSKLAPFYLIIGNHDRPNNSNFLTEEHAFNSMKRWPNVVVVDKVVTFKNFVFVPYVPNNRFNDALQTLSNYDKKDNTKENQNKYTAIFCHQEFKGAQMGRVISETGDNWSVDRTLIISGHIHEYGNPQKNIYYVGTPRQQTFGETTDKKISLFTFNVDGSYIHERLEINLPLKITDNIKVSELNGYSPDLTHKIKLIITGTESEIKTISKNKKIHDLKKQGVKITFHTVINNDIKVKNFKDVEKKPYLDRLLSEISDNHNMLSVWQTIF